MTQLVLYYSLSGKTKAIAEDFASQNGYDIREVVPQEPITTLKAFTLCPKAMAGGTVPVNAIGVSLENYDTVHVFAPIWAGFPAPPVNTALGWLPPGTEVTLTFVSKSGKSNKMFKLRQDLKLKSVKDIKSA
jgi:flavodoxin